MAPSIVPVQTSAEIPRSTSVVVIGGGIVGLTAALTLVERGIPVTVLEKGRLAGEQSSRNLGWIRKMGRELHDVPLARQSEILWEGMAERVGTDVGYRKAGILYVARSQAEMDGHRAWLDAVGDDRFDARLVTSSEIDALAPGGAGKWTGGIFMASDGRAEPTLASSAIARAAIEKGATIVENCAARLITTTAGHVSGVVTERGEIRCGHVILAGGLWSRRFLGNMGIDLPTLPVVASVLQTQPMDVPVEVAIGGPDFSFRKSIDGSFIITQRGGYVVPLTMDSLLLGARYLKMVRTQWKHMRLSLGSHFLSDMGLARRWQATEPTPFESLRTMDPAVHHGLIKEALDNLARAWPVFKDVPVRQSWAGMIDVTPDSLPVICAADQQPGLTLATGFSGHGFGTSPAAGQLAADIATGAPPIVDPAPYRLGRF